MNERRNLLFRHDEAETPMEVFSKTLSKVASGPDLAPVSDSDPTDQRNLSEVSSDFR